MLRIVTGRSGSGKSEKMISLMRGCENAIYIVPEQYSFAAEKKITASYGISGMGNPYVYSFRRLSYHIEEIVGREDEDITPTGRVMVLYDIIKKLSGELTLYGGGARRGEMTSLSAVIVTTFKQYNITKEKILKAMEKTDNSLLKKKLCDCALICGAYDSFLQGGYRDSDDILAVLKRNIEKCDYLDKYDIFIDSFTAFTPLEMSVIDTMVKKCRSVTVSLCIGDDGECFYTAKRSMKSFCDTYKGKVEIIRTEGAMFASSEEMKCVEKSFFEEEEEIFDNATDKIRIHRADNKYNEVVNAARWIESLCRDKGYRYKDIVIVAREMGDYEKEIEDVFESFDIPFFMDKKTPLSKESAANFMLSAIRVISKNWKTDAVFSYMKTAFSPVDESYSDELENYCIECGVRSRDWKSEEDWTMTDRVKQEGVDEEYLKRINLYRRVLARPVMALEEKIKGRHTGREMAVAFYEFLEDCGIEDKIEALSQIMSEEGLGEASLRMRQVYDLIIGVLESFDGAFAEKEMNSAEFLNIISAGVESVEIGVIPATVDSVCCGSIDRAKGHGAKAVILIGAAEGQFPAAMKETGIFTNSDKSELATYGIELPPDTLGKTYMEENLVYSALTCADESLFVSYSSSNEGEKESKIVKQLTRIFPKAVYTNDDGNVIDTIGSAKSTYDDFAKKYTFIQSGEEKSDEWHTVYEYYKESDRWKEKVSQIEKYTQFENRSQLIKEELLRARYGRDMSTSVSRLEMYAACPFRYFAEVTLGLKERKALEVTAADSGTFLHEFVDLFGKELSEDGVSWRDVGEEYIDKKTEEITLELLGGVNKHLIESSARIRNLFVRLKRIAKRSVTVLCEHMKKGKFEPLGYEIAFEENGRFTPLKITLPTGETVKLRGRIDRADILETQRGKFVRIIDYKSGSKNFSLSSIYNGFDLQLAIYLTTLCEKGHFKPAGMLYFRIDDPVIEAGRDAEKEKIERAIVKELKMDGLVLEDDEILEAMDINYARGSDVIPVKKKKDGSFDAHSNVATEADFKAISDHAKNTVKKLCKEILSGRSDIRPVKGSCDWCKMKSFCGFDPTLKGCGYKKVEKLNDKEALLKMRSE